MPQFPWYIVCALCLGDSLVAFCEIFMHACLASSHYHFNYRTDVLRQIVYLCAEAIFVYVYVCVCAVVLLV
jgi:hypothetical protein